MDVRMPFSVLLEVTPQCNLNCSHCYGMFGSLHSLDQSINSNSDTFAHVLDRLNKEEIMMYMLSGGEPFLRKDLLYLALDNAKKNNVIVFLNTNGTLITDDEARRLSYYNFHHILVSITSHDPLLHNNFVNSYDAFSKTIAGIKSLLKYKLPVHVNMVVTKNNFSQVISVARMLKSLGISHFSATPIQPTNAHHISLMITREQFVDLCDTLDLLLKEGITTSILQPLVYCMFDEPSKYTRFLQRKCYGGVIDFFIDANGNVKPCGLMGLPIGNILTESLHNLVAKMKGYRCDYNHPDSYVPLECHGCADVSQCKGGCRVGAQLLLGTCNSPNPYYRKPLKEKVVIPKISFFDFGTTDFDNLNDLLGYDITTVIVKEESLGKYLLISQTGKISLLSSFEFQLLLLIQKEKINSHLELDYFIHKYKLSNAIINNLLNTLRDVNSTMTGC